MNQRVGTCSLCGGDVVGFRGAWGAIVPPPPDKCSRCGAVRADDVVPMVRPMGQRPPGITAIPGVTRIWFAGETGTGGSL